MFEIGVAASARAGALVAGVLFAALAAALFAVETLPALVEFPARPGVAARLSVVETEAGRLLARLWMRPSSLERGAVVHPVVVEAVAHGRIARVPLNVCTAKDGRRNPGRAARGPLLVPCVASRPRELAAGGLRCGRGIAPAGDASGIFLARVRPATR